MSRRLLLEEKGMGTDRGQSAGKLSDVSQLHLVGALKDFFWGLYGDGSMEKISLFVAGISHLVRNLRLDPQMIDSIVDSFMMCDQGSREDDFVDTLASLALNGTPPLRSRLLKYLLERGDPIPVLALLRNDENLSPPNETAMRGMIEKYSPRAETRRGGMSSTYAIHELIRLSGASDPTLLRAALAARIDARPKTQTTVTSPSAQCAVLPFQKKKT